MTVNLQTFRDIEGNTALHLALKHKMNLDAEDILAKFPNLINVENFNSESPIYIAAKHNNTDGIKLCLEYHPLRGSLNNKCFKIFEKLKGTEPYYLSSPIIEFYKPPMEANNDKLVIILNLPDAPINENNFYENYNAAFKHFKESNIPILMIGNQRHSLSFQLIKDSINQYSLPENILIIVNGHGNVDDGDNLEISFDNTRYQTQIKDFFITLHSIFKDKPIQILMYSCHGGAAIKDVNLLPKDSTLLTLAQFDKTVREPEVIRMFDKSEDYKTNAQNFSLNHFLKKYLFSLEETNNIPTLAVSGGEAEFDYLKFTPFLGGKINDIQMFNIFNILEEYCTTSLQSCREDIFKAINEIEITSEINDLKSPEIIYKTYYENYLHETFLESGEITQACFIPEDPESLEKAYNDYVLTSPLTDYLICNEEFIPSDIKELCDKAQPTIPYFGKALAALYELYNINEESCPLTSDTSYE